jgi:hypothetical protein
MNKTLPFAIRLWVIFLAISIVFALLVYTSVQQSYRTSANDPQIEIVQDTADVLAQGAPPAQLVPQNPIDITKSLSAFIIVFDQDHKVVGSSVQINGQTPIPPSGVFDYAKSHEQNRFTWQPQKGVRIAAVIQKYSGKDSNGKDTTGYILVGRSLKEIEVREQSLEIFVGSGFLIAALVSLLLSLMLFGGTKHHHLTTPQASEPVPVKKEEDKTKSI